MKIAKFQAATMKDALAKVKDELGPDAMVVATREVRRGLLGTGIEVSAALEEPDEERPLPKRRSNPRGTEVPRGHGSGLDEGDIERIMAPLRSELRALRSMMRAASEPRGAADLRREVAALRRIVESMRAEPSEQVDIEKLAEGPRLCAETVGRVVALVGPTGVGKTTTIAKLAARSALVDNKKVAIATLDSFRVGGEEQMRIFADLIGVPLYVVAEPEDLQDQVGRLVDCDQIFVDTAGRSPRDNPALVGLRRAFRALDDLEVHLTMAAATSPQSIDDACARFQEVGLDRILFTKLDEADCCHELIRAPGRLSLPVAHITMGQAVPEDLDNATPELLLSWALGQGRGDVAA